MSVEKMLKMADAGLPAGLPGLSDAAAGHPFTAAQPTSAVQVGAPGPGMPGVPQMGATSNGMPDFLKMGGLRGKG